MHSNAVQTARFTPGTNLFIDGEYGVVKLFEKDLAAVLFDNKELKQFTPEQLFDLCRQKRINFVAEVPKRTRHTPAQRLTDADKETIRFREAYCRPLLRYTNPCSIETRKAVIAEVSKNEHFPDVPGLSTLARWFKNWRDDDYNMIAQVVRQRTQRKRICPELEALMDKAINKFYLKAKKTVAESYQDFKKLYEAEGFTNDCPGKSTFARRIKELPRLGVIAQRDGLSEARAAGRITTTGYQVVEANERVELDAAHFNIGLLNQKGYYLGTMTIYFAICCKTRCILGYQVTVGQKGENAHNVCQSLINSALLKQDKDYPYGGIAKKYVCDGGTAYRDERVKMLVQDMFQSDIEYCATRHGWGKAFVESFIRTIRKQFFEGAAGYGGKYEPGKYSDESAVKAARWTVEQAMSYLAVFIRDKYHHQVHSGLDGKTPAQAWDEAWNSAEYSSPMYVSDLGELERFKGLLVRNRTLNAHKGIFYQYQWFQSEELAAWYHELRGNTKKAEKIQVDIYVNPLDAREIEVMNPETGELICVPRARVLHRAVSFGALNAARKGSPKVEFEFSPDVNEDNKIKRRNVANRRGDAVLDLDEITDFDSLFDDVEPAPTPTEHHNPNQFSDEQQPTTVMNNDMEDDIEYD